MITIRPRLQLRHSRATGGGRVRQRDDVEASGESLPALHGLPRKVQCSRHEKKRTRSIPRGHATGRDRACRELRGADAMRVTAIFGILLPRAPMPSENAAPLFLDVETKEIIPEELGAAARPSPAAPDGLARNAPRPFRTDDLATSLVVFFQVHDCGHPSITLFPMATERNSSRVWIEASKTDA